MMLKRVIGFMFLVASAHSAAALTSIAATDPLNADVAEDTGVGSPAAPAYSVRTSQWTIDDHGPQQSHTSNRQIQPVRNDPVTNVDPGKDGTEEAEQSKGYDNNHAGCLIQQQNYPTGLADC
jgi:hypothetical protein